MFLRTGNLCSDRISNEKLEIRWKNYIKTAYDFGTCSIHSHIAPFSRVIVPVFTEFTVLHIDVGIYGV